MSSLDLPPAPGSSLYNDLDNYPWSTDLDFQSGLSAILGNNPSPEQAEELTLRARCFYYSRKFNTPVDFDTYKSHLEENSKSQQPSQTTTNTSPSQLSSQPSSTTPIQNTTSPTSVAHNNPFPNPDPQSLPAWTALAASNPPPVIPAETSDPGPKLSYQEIVDMIQSGKPIPGIKEIPDTVLAGQGTAASKTKRAKPWEKMEVGGVEETVGVEGATV